MFILGVCVCNTGFIGFDCSVTLSDAPRELTIPNKGLCSTKTRLCQKTNIFSIFYSENVYCKFQHFTVSQLKQIYFWIRFWNCCGGVTAYLFIHLFIYFFFLIGVCSIHCVAYHKYSGVTRSYFYSTNRRD